MNDIYNRKDEEFSVIGEVPESFKFNDPLYKEGFQAGAASRDAEVATLKTVPMRYRRMAFNAQLQDEVARLEQENEQLRTQINALRCAIKDAEVTKWIERVNSWTRDCERLADERDQLRAQIKQKDADNAELVAALERMRVAGGSQEFHIAWELAKDVLDKVRKP